MTPMVRLEAGGTSSAFQLRDAYAAT